MKELKQSQELLVEDSVPNPCSGILRIWKRTRRRGMFAQMRMEP